jgi:hypothetical protein
VNRLELQQLAEERLKDIEALLVGQRWAFTYYNAGYAVECALKACFLARMPLTGWVFQEKANIKDCLTHKFEDLIDLAGMREEHNARLKLSSTNGDTFRANWGIVTSWSVTARYVPKLEPEARALYEALTHDPDGVIPWIRTYW